MANKHQEPARTYSTPSRAVCAVRNMGASRGGKEVHYMISKTSNGRFYPVFVEKMRSGDIPPELAADMKQTRKRTPKSTVH